VIRHVELDRVKWIGESRRFEENRGFQKKSAGNEEERINVIDHFDQMSLLMVVLALVCLATSFFTVSPATTDSAGTRFAPRSFHLLLSKVRFQCKRGCFSFLRFVQCTTSGTSGVFLPGWTPRRQNVLQS
jgi:hypothetical protein